MSGKDAYLGKGVYLTTLGPENNSKAEIAINNYDGVALPLNQLEKVSFVVCVKLDDEDKRLFDGRETLGGRNVFIFRDDVDLAGDEGIKEWEVKEVKGVNLTYLTNRK